MTDVSNLWNEIGEFDRKELANSKDFDDVNWEARESARMQAYNVLFYRYLDCQTNDRDCA